MLKIAVITRYFPSSAEPWQGRSAYQTLRLIAQKTDVQVFYPKSTYPSILKSRSGDSTLDHSWSPPDVKTNYHDHPAIPVISGPFNGNAAAQVLLPHVRGFAPDLILSFILYPDSYAGLKIAKSLGVPLAAMSIGSDINRIGEPISARLTRTVLLEAAALLTVSEDLRVKAVAMGAPPMRAHTIVNGCDLGTFHPRERLQARRTLGIDSAEETVVYVGPTDLRKGLRELVAAAVLVRAQRPNLHVYLIGEGPDRSVIQKAIVDAKAANYIHLLPSCKFEEVAVWMAAADLATLPSYMEGCPNMVLEALACGRPVVDTSAGGIPEIMDDTCGCLVPPRDAQALGKGLSSVLERTWDPAQISAAHGRSWDAVAGEMLALLQPLVPPR